MSKELNTNVSSVTSVDFVQQSIDTSLEDTLHVSKQILEQNVPEYDISKDLGKSYDSIDIAMTELFDNKSCRGIENLKRHMTIVMFDIKYAIQRYIAIHNDQIKGELYTYIMLLHELKDAVSDLVNEYVKRVGNSTELEISMSHDYVRYTVLSYQNQTGIERCKLLIKDIYEATDRIILFDNLIARAVSNLVDRIKHRPSRYEIKQRENDPAIISENIKPPRRIKGSRVSRILSSVVQFCSYVKTSTLKIGRRLIELFMF